MRNYIEIWYVKTGLHTDPNYADTGVFGSLIEQQVEIANISDPFYVIDFGRRYFLMNKANLVNVLTNFAHFFPNFYNQETEVFVIDSPRPTWSRGH